VLLSGGGERGLGGEGDSGKARGERAGQRPFRGAAGVTFFSMSVGQRKKRLKRRAPEERKWERRELFQTAFPIVRTPGRNVIIGQSWRGFYLGKEPGDHGGSFG